MKRMVCVFLVSLLVFTSCKKSNNPISTTEDTSTVTYSGKVYHTVKIGSQTWLKENLDVGVVIDSMQNPSKNGIIEKYCYGNDTANCSKYGGLYQWDEAMAYDTANGAKGICPTGWHIPTKAEFDSLLLEVHYNSNSIKAVGQGTGSGAGTDSSGFSALLAGYRLSFGRIDYLGRDAGFLSSTENDAASPYYMDLWSTDSGISIGYGYKDFGYSIRYLKN